MRQVLRIGMMIMTIGLAQQAGAQKPPSWGSESSPTPNAGGSVSRDVNSAADRGMNKEIQYTNAGTVGPKLVVLPGQIKSNNSGFLQKFGPNNIADYGELELSKANFQVLERADLGPVLNEMQLAYGAGDPDAARKNMSKGKLKTTKWIVKFDILKAEEVAQEKKGFNGGVARNLIGIFGGGGGKATSAAQEITGSVDTESGAHVWIIGMRYKIIDAVTTDIVAQNYTEEKMEVGATGSKVAGISAEAAGGVSLDTLVQRLVQKCVWDIDAKHK
jgi:hypothetical protein